MMMTTFNMKISYVCYLQDSESTENVKKSNHYSQTREGEDETHTERKRQTDILCK